MITVIGIGNCGGDLTQAAAKKIDKLEKVYLKSALTKAGKELVKNYGSKIIPLDEYFTGSQNFDELTRKICDLLIANSLQNIGYATDGDGLDGVAAMLKSLTPEVEFVFGVAQNNTRAEQAELKISAYDALSRKPYLDTGVALHITEIDDKFVAGDIKLWLMDYYGDETKVNVFIKNKLQIVSLCDIDRLSGYDYSCELFICAQNGFYKDKYCFADLLRVMAKLTAPGGCPWDTAQTHESIRSNLIEEAYEAVDAINKGDVADMTEEIGDVLLQAVFHCDMGRRFGEFELADVISGLCSKLVTRHTHIFGENKAANADEALMYWERAKAEEKSYVSTADKINRIPDNFPSLLAAQKIYRKLVKAGVDGSGILSFACDAESGITEDEAGKKLFALCAKLSDCEIDGEVALSKIVARIKSEFASAEKSGNVTDFLNKL